MMLMVPLMAAHKPTPPPPPPLANGTWFQTKNFKVRVVLGHYHLMFVQVFIYHRSGFNQFKKRERGRGIMADS